MPVQAHVPVTFDVAFGQHWTRRKFELFHTMERQHLVQRSKQGGNECGLKRYTRVQKLYPRFCMSNSTKYCLLQPSLFAFAWEAGDLKLSVQGCGRKWSGSLLHCTTYLLLSEHYFTHHHALSHKASTYQIYPQSCCPTAGHMISMHAILAVQSRSQVACLIINKYPFSHIYVHIPCIHAPFHLQSRHAHNHKFLV